MRRFQSLLLAAGLMAAPATALAQPSFDPPAPSGPRLGVMVMTLTPELRSHFGSTDKTGVLVAKVEPGSPAALAGIAVGDMLVDVRGTKVDDAADVVSALSTAPKDAKVKVELVRDRKRQTLDVNLGNSTQSLLDTFPGLRMLREVFEQAKRSSST